MSRSKNHTGCGCSLCKPWKHGLDEELKPSERRRVQVESEWSEDQERWEMLGDEAMAASYCHHYGPCASCMAKKDAPESCDSGDKVVG